MSEQVSYRRALEELGALLSGRWVPAVLTALAGGPLRFSDFIQEINEADPRGVQRKLTEKVLADTLRVLEQARLIANRRQSAAVGGSSYYELTTHGKTFLQELRPAIKWAVHYINNSESTEHTT